MSKQLRINVKALRSRWQFYGPFKAIFKPWNYIQWNCKFQIKKDFGSMMMLLCKSFLKSISKDVIIRDTFFLDQETFVKWSSLHSYFETSWRSWIEEIQCVKNEIVLFQKVVIISCAYLKLLQVFLFFFFRGKEFLFLDSTWLGCPNL